VIKDDIADYFWDVRRLRICRLFFLHENRSIVACLFMGLCLQSAGSWEARG
jgi:hypothetical protein